MTTEEEVIEVGDTVRIHGRSSTHEVLEIHMSDPRKIGIRWGENDFTWWPAGELDIVKKHNQMELF